MIYYIITFLIIIEGYIFCLYCYCQQLKPIEDKSKRIDYQKIKEGYDYHYNYYYDYFIRYDLDLDGIPESISTLYDKALKSYLVKIDNIACDTIDTDGGRLLLPFGGGNIDTRDNSALAHLIIYKLKFCSIPFLILKSESPSHSWAFYLHFYLYENKKLIKIQFLFKDQKYKPERHERITYYFHTQLFLRGRLLIDDSTGNLYIETYTNGADPSQFEKFVWDPKSSCFVRRFYTDISQKEIKKHEKRNDLLEYVKRKMKD
jgi:hypothetical protein